jgi:hypothetical protein
MREYLLQHLGRFTVGLFCVCLILKGSGCGTSSYGDAVGKGKIELERLSKFAELDPEYRRIFVTPYVFKMPRMFVADDDRDKKWIAYGPKFLTTQSRDPYRVKTIGEDARGTIDPTYAEPAELNFPPFTSGAFIGTLVCEYNYEIQLENGKAEGKLPLTMTLWGFSATGQKQGPPPPPKEEAVAAQVKNLGKFNDNGLRPVRDAYGKAGKVGRWEEESIVAYPTATDPRPNNIEAKLLRVPVRSKYLTANGENRRMVEKNGHLYLWTFRLDTVQFYLALRAPDEMFSGETPIYSQDLENSDSDPIVKLGRAVIGTFRVEPSFVQEFEEFKKKGPPGKKAA